MHLGLDIDGTITAAPRYFAQLARSWRNAGRHVHVISSRSDTPEVRRQTAMELTELGIVVDGLHLIPGIAASHILCPHQHLDWYARYQWQKVALAMELGVSIYFDDDPKVLSLFRTYAPKIYVHEASVKLEVQRDLSLEVTRLLAMPFGAQPTDLL